MESNVSLVVMQNFLSTSLMRQCPTQGSPEFSNVRTDKTYVFGSVIKKNVAYHNSTINIRLWVTILRHWIVAYHTSDRIITLQLNIFICQIVAYQTSDINMKLWLTILKYQILAYYTSDINIKLWLTILQTNFCGLPQIKDKHQIVDCHTSNIINKMDSLEAVTQSKPKLLLLLGCRIKDCRLQFFNHKKL